MTIWLLILVVWAAYAAIGAAGGVNVAWLITIGCWACVDLAWRWSMWGNVPTGSAGHPSVGLRVAAVMPHLLYCLPLSKVPVLGWRLFPGLPWMQWTGAAMCIAGTAFAIWARRVLAKCWNADVAITPTHALVMRGPYKLVRHPIYLGFLLAQLGMILALGEVRVVILVFGIDRLLKKLPLEEAALRSEYPAEYEQYSQRVRRLVPFVW